MDTHMMNILNRDPGLTKPLGELTKKDPKRYGYLKKK